MKGMSVINLINYGTGQLKEKAISTPRLDCELILAFVLNKDRKFLYMHPVYVVETGAKDMFYKLIEERAAGMPVQYITGHQEFMGLDFCVNRSALIPRPDTEVLVDKVIEWLKEYREKSGPVIVDVGTGSGAIAVSVAYCCPDARVIATDISHKALEIARINACKNGVEGRIDFIKGDLLIKSSLYSFRRNMLSSKGSEI